MREKNLNLEPRDWHGQYLEDREKDLAEGKYSLISLDEFEAFWPIYKGFKKY